MVYKDKRALIATLGLTKGTRVLDVGFSGQAVQDTDFEWPHALLQEHTDDLYGVDLDFDSRKYPLPRYVKASAEDFSFPVKFDLIFAGDLIEHLSNPGLFLECSKRHLAPGGRLVMTTPNTFSFFSLIEKLTHDEPNVNPDHTLYLNKRVIKVLLRKNGMEIKEFGYLYTLGTLWLGGWKRKLLASLYWLVSKATPKFLEDMVVVAA